MDWDEVSVHYDREMDPLIRDRILRRAAVRELLEEAGGGDCSDPKMTIYFEPLRLKLSNREVVRFQSEVWSCHMPAGLAFFEVDAERSRKMKVGRFETYVFLYVICPLRDGKEFAAGGSWLPQEWEGCYEVETKSGRGVHGYRWQRLSQIQVATAADENLVDWLQSFICDRRSELLSAARDLQGLPQTGPAACCTWKTPSARCFFLLLAAAAESEAWIQQRDQQGCLLSDSQVEQVGEEGRRISERSKLVQRLFAHLQAPAPVEFPGKCWGSSSPKELLLLCADASQSEDWQRYKDDYHFDLLEWESWASGLPGTTVAWMQ
ncbi:HERC1, partial [Symbiodinium sp. CCMP2592]